METVILVVHIFLALGIIAVVLIQPPENSSLSGLGGSNPMAGMNVRGQGNILTRTTAILATGFIITSLILAVLASHSPQSDSILDKAESISAKQTETNKTKSAVEANAPSVPLAKE